MKKFLMAAGLVAISAGAAQAQVDVDVNLFGNPRPVYVEQRPVYVQPRPSYYHGNDRDRHRNYDWGYWNNERDHRDDHHDNGHHYGRDKDDYRR